MVNDDPSAEQLRELVALGPAVTYTAEPWGSYPQTYISDNVKRQTGYEAEAFLKDPEFWLGRIHPDDVSGVLEDLPSVFNREVLRLTYRFRHKDGSYIWMLDELQLDRDAEGNPDKITGYWIDISERKRVEEDLEKAQAELARLLEDRTRELDESEARLQALVDNSPTGISFRDPDRKFVYLNKTFRQWLQIEDGDRYEGKTSYDFLPPENADWHTSLLREIRETHSSIAREYTVHHPDGVSRTLLNYLFPILDVDGQLVGIGANAFDVSEQRRLETQLQEVSKLDALRQMAGGIAHEFNNLLQIIAGNLEMASGNTQDMERLERSITNSLSATYKGGTLTDRLLAYVGRRAAKPEIIAPGIFVTKLVELIAPVVGESIEIETRIKDDPWPIETDPAQLEGALINLAMNARDAMADGGNITIDVASAYLDEAFAAECPFDIIPGDYAMIAMTDTGTGMSPEVAEHAVEPFYTTKEVGQGTGLGLSVVYGFVQQSGGYMKIDSEVGQGARVALYLPRKKAANAQSQSEAAESKENLIPGRRTFLIVEDNEQVLSVTASMLEAQGQSVYTALNGPQALAQLRRLTKVDFLLTDMIMPGGMNGYKLAKAVRELRPQTKVIFMTGYADTELEARGYLGGDDPILRKPFSRDQLFEIVREMIEEEDS